ncbi:MAG: hypothetical protein LBS31_08085 [Candidatus Adiutrix sp.]|nr:hypothetical protein [Candidatus Adiutrix sp.]
MANRIGQTRFIPHRRLSLNGAYQAEKASNDRHTIVMSMMHILRLTTF